MITALKLFDENVEPYSWWINFANAIQQQAATEYYPDIEQIRNEILKKYKAKLKYDAQNFKDINIEFNSEKMLVLFLLTYS